MRISIPHLGNLYIPLKTMFGMLDVDYIAPPLNTQRTLSLGVKHAPEGLCMPFKLTLGNLIEVAELGADTLVMPGGYGTCRLGYYSRVQQQILRDLGYDVTMIPLGVDERKAAGLLKTIKLLAGDAPWLRILPAFRFGMKKLDAIDNLERKVQKVRAVEQKKGTANRVYADGLKAIDEAPDVRGLKRVIQDVHARLDGIPVDQEAVPLVVGITGEFFVLLEPFSNFDVESELGKLGVEVRRSTYTSGWTRFSFFLNALGIDEKTRIHRAARPYLKRDIGGDGWESVGEKVLHSREWDGMIHLAPFTCMPEIIAQNIMPRTDEKIPVLTIHCDEQITKTGVLTRLEAFVDLLERRQKKGVRPGRMAEV